MLVAVGKSEGNDPRRRICLLGLSAENIIRLQQDQPIRIDLGKYGIPDLDLLIWAGNTEEEMGDMIKELIGPETKVHIDPRLYGGSD